MSLVFPGSLPHCSRSEMSFSDALFWILFVMAVGSALAVLFTRGIVHMAFWLLASLAGFAGLYLHLGADFLGFVQVLVYIGGILILFLFGVMLTHREDVPVRSEASWRFLLPGTIAGVLMVGLIITMISVTPWQEKTAAEFEPTSSGIGARFMTTYILPFEAVSVLLLVAMVGATYIARSRHEEEEEPGGEEP